MDNNKIRSSLFLCVRSVRYMTEQLVTIVSSLNDRSSNNYITDLSEDSCRDPISSSCMKISESPEAYNDRYGSLSSESSCTVLSNRAISCESLSNHCHGYRPIHICCPQPIIYKKCRESDHGSNRKDTIKSEKRSEKKGSEKLSDKSVKYNKDESPDNSIGKYSKKSSKTNKSLVYTDEKLESRRHQLSNKISEKIGDGSVRGDDNVGEQMVKERSSQTVLMVPQSMDNKTTRTNDTELNAMLTTVPSFGFIQPSQQTQFDIKQPTSWEELPEENSPSKSTNEESLLNKQRSSVSFKDSSSVKKVESNRYNYKLEPSQISNPEKLSSKRDSSQNRKMESNQVKDEKLSSKLDSSQYRKVEAPDTMHGFQSKVLDSRYYEPTKSVSKFSNSDKQSKENAKVMNSSSREKLLNYELELYTDNLSNTKLTFRSVNDGTTPVKTKDENFIIDRNSSKDVDDHIIQNDFYVNTNHEISDTTFEDISVLNSRLTFNDNALIRIDSGSNSSQFSDSFSAYANLSKVEEHNEFNNENELDYNISLLASENQSNLFSSELKSSNKALTTYLEKMRTINAMSSQQMSYSQLVRHVSSSIMNIDNSDFSDNLITNDFDDDDDDDDDNDDNGVDNKVYNLHQFKSYKTNEKIDDISEYEVCLNNNYTVLKNDDNYFVLKDSNGNNSQETPKEIEIIKYDDKEQLKSPAEVIFEIDPSLTASITETGVSSNINNSLNDMCCFQIVNITQDSISNEILPTKSTEKSIKTRFLKNYYCPPDDNFCNAGSNVNMSYQLATENFDNDSTLICNSFQSEKSINGLLSCYLFKAALGFNPSYSVNDNYQTKKHFKTKTIQSKDITQIECILENIVSKNGCL